MFQPNTNIYTTLSIIMAKTRAQNAAKTGTPTKKAAPKSAEASPAPKKVAKRGAKKASPPAAETSAPKAAKGKAAKATPVKATKNTKITKNSKATELFEVVPSAVASKAISELVKYINKPKESTEESDKKSLFDDEDDNNDDLFLQITTKKFYSDNLNLKPKQIQLTHAIKARESIRTCLIIRDLLITTEQQLENIEAENFETLKQIIPMKDLKKEYKPYEKRRQLYSDFDLFLVDDACLNMLPQALGKVFYGNGTSTKKVPHAIKVTSSSKPKEFSIDTFKNQLNKVLSSTSFLPPVGVNISVKFGSTEQSETELSQNLFDVLKAFKKDEIRSIMAKASTSPALPLYYAENLYDEADVKAEVSADKKKKSKKDIKEVKLSAFEKGLLELGDADEVAKIIGKKLGESKKNGKK